MATMAGKSGSEMRFQNVTVYIGGQSEYGTLKLSRHHLKFIYTPKSTTPKPTANPGTQRSLPTTSKTGSTLTEGSAISQEAKVETEPPKAPEPRDHPQTKEIWVPYPMINFCLLRPSLTSTSHVQNFGDRTQADFSNDDDDEPFPPVFGTASYERPSVDSTYLSAHASPARPSSPISKTVEPVTNSESGRQPAIRIRRRDFQMMAFHFHASPNDASPDESARKAFFTLRSRCCISNIEDMHAFHFDPPKQETAVAGARYNARSEYARMGISEKASSGPGEAWRLSSINQDYSYSSTYPSVLCVPRAVSDNTLKYGGVFRSRARIPCLSYLHSNGGSITRSSQPMVGVQNRRNPQDERLVSAIFSSHTPPLLPFGSSPSLHPAEVAEPGNVGIPSIDVDEDLYDSAKTHGDQALEDAAGNSPAPPRKKVYGSTRQNLIVDARPKINALANRATGGGIEDVANYSGNSGLPVQKMFLNIANIHVMRGSLDKVVESLASADYLNMKPNQELLRKSGWLGHIAGLLEGSEVVARVVGLGGSHVLVHCSDGWDRTAQVSALAQVMLDPHYRTLEGFITLIQKEFLSFGHKFRDRNGIEGSEKWFEIENERVAPTARNREVSGDQTTSLNVLGSRAITGAKNWFEKNRGNLFRQQNSSHESLPDAASQSLSPPPNPVIHSPPTASGKEDGAHRISEKEIAPIFHQFLDATYQLQYQNPDVFEFNERFLRRLYYHTYACQYGEFLFNTERDRIQLTDKVPSVWNHFISRRQEFTNPSFKPRTEDPLLFARRHAQGREVEVRWWSSLFRCQDEDMNLPRALLPSFVDSPSLTTTHSAAQSVDERLSASATTETVTSLPSSNGAIKETKSTPSLSSMRDTLTAGVSTLAMRFQAEKADMPPAQSPSKSTTALQDTVVAKEQASTAAESHMPPLEDGGITSGNEDEEPKPHDAEPTQLNDGDPLGVSSNVAQRSSSTAAKGGNTGRGLDFAAFAAQNAYTD